MIEPLCVGLTLFLTAKCNATSAPAALPPLLSDSFPEPDANVSCHCTSMAVSFRLSLATRLIMQGAQHVTRENFGNSARDPAICLRCYLPGVALGVASGATSVAGSDASAGAAVVAGAELVAGAAAGAVVVAGAAVVTGAAAAVAAAGAGSAGGVAWARTFGVGAYFSTVFTSTCAFSGVGTSPFSRD